MINIKGTIIFHPKDYCPICTESVWYNENEVETINNDGFITCPCCGNTIKINKYERYSL